MLLKEARAKLIDMRRDVRQAAFQYVVKLIISLPYVALKEFLCANISILASSLQYIDYKGLSEKEKILATQFDLFNLKARHFEFIHQGVIQTPKYYENIGCHFSHQNLKSIINIALVKKSICILTSHSHAIGIVIVQKTSNGIYTTQIACPKKCIKNFLQKENLSMPLLIY